MGAQVTWNYAQWIARYPEFADDVDETLAGALLAEAQVHHRNDGRGPVDDPGAQLVLLNMMMAHIAQLYRIENGQAVSELVGRINSATQGSVTVAADVDVGDGPSQWLAQTKYGFSYWAATAPYRAFRYFPGPRRYFGPIYGGRPL